MSSRPLIRASRQRRLEEVAGTHRQAATRNLGAIAEMARVLAPFWRPHWRRLTLAVAALIGSSLVALLRPWPLKFLIDEFLRAGTTGAVSERTGLVIAGISGAIVLLAALQGLLGYTKDYFLDATSLRVAFSLRSTLFAHIQRLSLAYHDTQRTGELITSVTNDVTMVQLLFTDALVVGGATALLQVAGTLIIMLAIDWKLGLIASLSAPMIAVTVAYYRERIKTQERKVREKEGDVVSLAQETMSSIRVVKAFGRERFEAQRFHDHGAEMVEAGIRVSRLDARFAWALNVVTGANMAMLVAFGAHRVVAGILTAGTLLVFIQYMRELQAPMTALSRLTTKFSKAAVRVERLLAVLDERPGVEERPDAVAAPRFRGEIRFDNVSFGYDSSRRILNDVTLAIPAGQVTAIVGATGAGKSTIASLVLRLYDPQNGAITIDGRDIRTFTLDSLTSQVGVVLQESLLFQTTIRENIAYGKPSATLEEIKEAGRIACCDEFIEKLPKGLDTVVGERGGTLSGGQRQRIAIARAVVRNSPILVLDEPTTGLDAESEDLVMRALERLMLNRTTLLIAHKLSTVRRADRIYVLADGRLVESGSHNDLIERNGAYARAFRLQG